MVEVTKQNKSTIAVLISVLVAAIVAAAAGIGVNINLQQSEDGYQAQIEYVDNVEAAPEPVMTVEEPGGRGSYEEVVTEFDGENIPTVESVESDGPVTEVNIPECPEGQECGRGAAFNVEIGSPEAFRSSTLGRCIDTDGYYGGQCWDLASAFWIAYTGRNLSTCGTGAAKGSIADGCWQQNAGNDFTMIWDPTQLQAGDWVFFNTGEWGHVGMAQGNYNNGYVTLLGQNQGGGYCNGGGAATNLINISLKDFAGAFRPNIYIPPAPAPEPEPTPEPETPVIDVCQRREVLKGDTLGKIMLECRGEIEWGTPMDEYASHWYSTKLQRYLTVYDGWVSVGGYGLFAGDVIEYK